MKRAVVVAVVVVAVSVGVVERVGAQWVVNDPANTAQNAMSVAQEAQQVMGQIQEIQHQFQQLQQMKRDLEQLSPAQLEDLADTFRRLQQLYDEAEQISMRWEQIASEYEAMYGDPDVVDAEEFRQQQDEWSRQTDAAIGSAMQQHGVVEGYDERSSRIESMAEASQSAEGTLAAIQAGNEMAKVLLNQQMEMTELMVAHSRAMLSYVREEQARRDAQEERSRRQFMEGYGGDAPARDVPDTLPEFQ